MKNERPPAVHTCRADCLTCPLLIRHNQFVSNTNVRNYFSIHCKLQNYIYLLTYTHCGIQYVGESVTLLNLRLSIHRRRKSECENSFDHYRNVCENSMLEYRLQCEDCWIETLLTVYPYGLNERTKFMNKDSPIGKPFPPLPK